MNKLLFITVCLLGFFMCMIIYLKSYYPKQSFENIYQTEDTRMKYSKLPPVNPMVLDSKLINNLPASPVLFNDGPLPNTNFLVSNTENSNLLQMDGVNQMIQIPLQMNNPYNEPLRTYDVLVTPYNKIKYGKC